MGVSVAAVHQLQGKQERSACVVACSVVCDCGECSRIAFCGISNAAFNLAWQVTRMCTARWVLQRLGVCAAHGSLRLS